MQDISVEKSDLIAQAFDFWFSNHEHIRSPFPNYIQNDLKLRSTEKFENWITNLKDGAQDEMNDEMFAEKFEEIMFECAYELVITEDEKTSILYPFLPKIYDKLNDQDGHASEIIDRNIYKENEVSYLKISCKRLNDNEKWSTSFELPT